MQELNQKINNIEDRLDALEKQTKENTANILSVNKKNRLIVETLDQLKNQIECFEDGDAQQYSVDLSKGSISFKNPRVENIALIGFLMVLLTLAIGLAKNGSW